MKQQKEIVFIVLLLLIILVVLYAVFWSRTASSHTSIATGTFTPWLYDQQAEQDLDNFELVEVPTVEFLLKSTKFLYSLQTESCLPAYLNTYDIIGNSTACQCDVLVLSFRQECNEIPPAHVEYIFATGTSWNVGRNQLFETAKRRSKKYLYYIFMDDDVQFTTQLEVNPWRAFEEFLLNIEPAVGVVDDTKRLEVAYKARKELGCDEGDPDFINAPQFDSAFNAFHYRAVDHILPYTTAFDRVSWWFSGWYAKIRCDIMFPGQTVMMTKILRSNLQHRNYPQVSPYTPQYWGMVMKEVESSVPQKYRNIPMLLAWKEGGQKHQEKTRSHCFPLPTPHMPIRPFGYLDTEHNR